VRERDHQNEREETTVCRVHNNEGRACALHALPEADWFQVLPRLNSIYYGPFWNRGAWFLR